MGRAYEAKDMYDQAVHEYSTAAGMSLRPPETLAKMNDVYAKSGWKAYVQTALDAMLGRSNKKTPPFVVATYYARLSDKEKSIECLQKAYEDRDFRMTRSPYRSSLTRSDPIRGFKRMCGSWACRSN